jgi:hypothetical protein
MPEEERQTFGTKEVFLQGNFTTSTCQTLIAEPIMWGQTIVQLGFRVRITSRK